MLADFLKSCKDAMPHVKGLEILNDCEENQRLIQKLPDWTASIWNRQVTQCLHNKKDFPSFKEFSEFVSIEAEIACNPITSLHALRSSDSNMNKRQYQETAIVHHTQAATDGDHQSCTLCQDGMHQLQDCSKFTAMSLGARQNFIKEKGHCYGCLQRGHVVKNCDHRHFCDVCRARHPTCLHNFNYGTETPRPFSGTE